MLRKFGFGLSSVLLKLTIVLLALFGAGQAMLGSPDALKDTAKEVGLYEGLVDGLYENLKNQAEGSSEDVPFDDPAVEKAVEGAFSEELVRQNGESVINGIYGWLQGDTAEPEFSIDFSQAQDELTTALANVAEERYTALPACSLSQIQSLNAQELDIFNLPCRLPGLSATQVGDRAESELAKNMDFLSESVYTAEDLPKDENGNTVVDNLAAAPAVFQVFEALPWLLGALATALATAILFLAPRKQKGVRSVSWTFAGTGVFLLLAALILRWLFTSMNQNGSDQLQQTFQSFIRGLANTYTEALLLFCVAYIIIGGLGFGTIWLYNKRRQPTPVKK